MGTPGNKTRIRSAPQPPPPTVSGLNGAMPTVYNVKWQTFTDLTPAQVDWYRAQPEWQNFMAWVALDPPNATIHANAPDMATIIAALQAANQPIAVNPTPLPPTPSPVSKP